MSCIAFSIATEGFARPFWPRPAVLRSCTVPPRLRVPAQASSLSFTRLSSGTAKGEPGRARRHSGLLLSRTPSPKPVWVPFP
jgi:hypothetical protein